MSCTIEKFAVYGDSAWVVSSAEFSFQPVGFPEQADPGATPAVTS